MTRCRHCLGRDVLTLAGPRHAEARVCRHRAGCGRCHDRGVEVYLDAMGREVAAPCGCGLLELARRTAIYDRAAIPARFHDARFDGYQARDAEGSQHGARVLFTELIDRFRPGDRGVGLSGPAGVGKTHLLAALAGYLSLQRGIEVRYTDFSDLVSELRARFEVGGGSEALVGTIADAEVLCIDELGKGRATEWEQSIVDAIISRRYNRGLTLFYATNHPLDDHAGGHGLEPLSARIGARAASRLREMTRQLSLQGPDGRAMRVNAGAAGDVGESKATAEGRQRGGGARQATSERPGGSAGLGAWATAPGLRPVAAKD